MSTLSTVGYYQVNNELSKLAYFIVGTKAEIVELTRMLKDLDIEIKPMRIRDANENESAAYAEHGILYITLSYL